MAIQQNRVWVTEVTDYWSGKPYTHPPTPYPSEFAAKQSAEDLTSRRKCLEVKVKDHIGGTVATYESVQMNPNV